MKMVPDPEVTLNSCWSKNWVVQLPAARKSISGRALAGSVLKCGNYLKTTPYCYTPAVGNGQANCC